MKTTVPNETTEEFDTDIQCEEVFLEDYDIEELYMFSYGFDPIFEKFTGSE